MDVPADDRTLIAVARILGVQLEPWQEWALRRLLGVPEDQSPLLTDVPPGRCDATYHPFWATYEPLRCELPSGHWPGNRHSSGETVWELADRPDVRPGFAGSAE